MTNSSVPPLVTILGPTASGKTSLAVSLAEQLSTIEVCAEIISADSRQVYQGMDIGTGKDLYEYRSTPYHLIDIIQPTDEYNLFEYVRDFSKVFTELSSTNRLPILAGGTGMYLDAILNRYKLTIAKKDKNARQLLEKKSERELIELLRSFDKDLHNTTDLIDKDRIIRAIEIASANKEQAPELTLPEFKPLVLGIKLSRDEVKTRITKRLKQRFEEGMIDEVDHLRKEGLTWEKLDFFGLEYRFIAQYLQGHLNYNDMFQKLNSAIHAFSKQQSKWFRNIEKKGCQITWLDKEPHIEAKAFELVKEFLNN